MKRMTWCWSLWGREIWGPEEVDARTERGWQSVVVSLWSLFWLMLRKIRVVSSKKDSSCQTRKNKSVLTGPNQWLVGRIVLTQSSPSLVIGFETQDHPFWEWFVFSSWVSWLTITMDFLEKQQNDVLFNTTNQNFEERNSKLFWNVFFIYEVTDFESSFSSDSMIMEVSRLLSSFLFDSPLFAFISSIFFCFRIILWAVLKIPFVCSLHMKQRESFL